MIKGTLIAALSSLIYPNSKSWSTISLF